MRWLRTNYMGHIIYLRKFEEGAASWKTLLINWTLSFSDLSCSVLSLTVSITLRPFPNLTRPGSYSAVSANGKFHATNTFAIFTKCMPLALYTGCYLTASSKTPLFGKNDSVFAIFLVSLAVFMSHAFGWSVPLVGWRATLPKKQGHLCVMCARQTLRLVWVTDGRLRGIKQSHCCWLCDSYWKWHLLYFLYIPPAALPT